MLNYIDASMQGYGVHFQGKSVGQRWSTADQNAYGDNINCLELKAVEYGLRSFRVELYGKSILLRVDNTTAVSYINLMGGTHSVKCNDIARDIWSYAIDHNIHLSAAHIAGSDNVHADHASRNFVNPDIELYVQDNEFIHICEQLMITPEIDLFASYANKKSTNICLGNLIPVLITLTLSVWTGICFHPFTCFLHLASGDE